MTARDSNGRIVLGKTVVPGGHSDSAGKKSWKLFSESTVVRRTTNHVASQDQRTQWAMILHDRGLGHQVSQYGVFGHVPASCWACSPSEASFPESHTHRLLWVSRSAR